MAVPLALGTRLQGTKQLRHRVAGTGSAGLPVLDPCGVDPNPLFALGSDRVEEADAFDEPSSAPAAAVRNHHMVEGPAFCAGTGESNFDHG